MDDLPLPNEFEVKDFLIRSIPQAIHSPELKTVAQAFMDGIGTIRDFLSLPILMLLFGEAGQHALLELVQSLMSFHRERIDYSEILSFGTEDKLKQVLTDAFNDKEKRATFIQSAQKVYPIITETRPDAYHALMTAATTMAWTTFECLATDAWIAALNTRPPQNVGMLMRQKFDFTSLAGFRKAYKAVFGDTDQVKQLFKNDDLEVLEAVRHLLVHRAGRVDQTFLNRAKSLRLAQPIPMIDTPFPLDAAFTSRCINAVIVVGHELLVFVDEWANQQP